MLSLLSFSLQGSLRKEFPQNIGGSDVCFFCRKRVYVMERLSAEGKFFHRSCFKCDYCGTTLRLSSYAFDVEDGMKSRAATNDYFDNWLVGRLCFRLIGLKSILFVYFIDKKHTTLDILSKVFQTNVPTEWYTYSTLLDHLS